MKAAHILVDGIVQGVGFRWFAMNLANQYGLNGWVRNRWRGDVEILVEGEEDVIRQFIREIKAGPSHGKVESVEVEWKQPENQFSNFNIIR